jgi:hypothetical protein
MKKCYLFLYSDAVGTREVVKDSLNKINEITDWRYELPNSFYLISELSAQDLANKFKEVINRQTGMTFIISEIGQNSYGWLNQESWHLIQNKSRMKK